MSLSCPIFLRLLLAVVFFVFAFGVGNSFGSISNCSSGSCSVVAAVRWLGSCNSSSCNAVFAGCWHGVIFSAIAFVLGRVWLQGFA